MRSIVIFYDFVCEFMDKYLNRFLPEVDKSSGAKIYTYSGASQIEPNKLIIDEKLKYLFGGRDNKIYSSVLDYCARRSIDRLFFPRLMFPEYLLAELMVRPKLKTRISFGVFGLADANKSLARAHTYLELLKKKQVSNMFIHSIFGEDIIFPKGFVMSKDLKYKVKPLYDPIFDEIDLYRKSDRLKARIKYGVPDNSLCILYFGAMVFGKGIDVLEKAFKFMNKDVMAIVASNPQTINFSFSVDLLKTNPRIKYIDRFIPHEELGDLFAAADLVVLPYKRVYEFDTSGVFVQAVLAKKPVIVPDFYPFNSVVRRYRLGSIFKPESPRSLASEINKFRNNYCNRLKRAKFEGYLKRIQGWDEMASLVAK